MCIRDRSSSVQKFSVGLVGMTGMDLIGDAQLNLIPQIASSFGVSIGVVATVAGGALAAGAAIAIGRDITRIQCDDCLLYTSICARCNQPIKRVKLKDGSIMQAAEFAATHEGMCADCYKATRLNVAL